MRARCVVSFFLAVVCTEPVVATRDATVGDDRTVSNDVPDGGRQALPTVPLGADA